MVRQRICAGLLALAVVLSFAALADAAGVNGFWKELGGSASGNGLSLAANASTVNDAWAAIDPTGLPVVAFTEIPAGGGQGTILVRRWTGSAWQTVSPTGGLTPNGSLAQIRITPGGAYFVAWLEDDGFGLQIRLLTKAASATTWAPISGANTSLVTSLNGSVQDGFSLAVTSAGTPYVAFNANAQTGLVAPAEGAILDGSTQTYVMTFNSAQKKWVYLGSDPTTGGGASNASSFSLDGGSEYVTHEVTFSPSMTADASGAPIVAFTYDTTGFTPAPPADGTTDNADIYVVRWSANASAWTALGPAVPQSDDGPNGPGRGGPGGVSGNTTFSDAPSIAFGGGQLWLGWQDGENIFVSHFDGSVWSGINGSTDTGINDPTINSENPMIAVDSTGQVVVTWDTFSLTQPGQVFVQRGTLAGGFGNMGPDSSSGDGISAAALNAFGPIVATSPVTTQGPAIVWINRLPGNHFEAYLRQFSTAAAQTLNASLTGSGSGSVSSVPDGITCGTECSATFPTGQVVTLTATADPGSIFTSFTGCTATATPGVCTVTMSAAHNVSVAFVSAHTLSVSLIGDGKGTVTSAPTGITCGAACSKLYADGTLVTLTAAADAVSTNFLGWGGLCASRGTNTTCAVPVGANISPVTANFAKKVLTLTAAAIPPAGKLGAGQVVGNNFAFACSGPAGSGGCTAPIEFGTLVSLQATPSANNRFLNWTGAFCGNSTNATCAFTMTANVTETALFRQTTPIVVIEPGNGSGSVKSTAGVLPPGISCGASCSGTAFAGEVVTLTATPTTGSTLSPAGGACTWTSAGVCSLVANNTSALTNVSAVFTLRKQHLKVTVTGNGSVSSPLPSFIACGDGGTTCDIDVDFGTVIALGVAPDVDSARTSLTGCTALNGSTCVVNMTANATVAAAFVPAHTLFVQAVGNGTGQITSPGLTCANNCLTSELVPASTIVTLTPSPAVGTNFTWVAGNVSGVATSCTGTTPCTIAMTANRSATGQFTLQRDLLTITNKLNGSVVSTNPLPGAFVFDCGDNVNTACQQTFDFGTPVVLVAQPDDGFFLSAWSGVTCGGKAGNANATCAFSMKANTTVTPVYRKRTGVALTRLGNGAGAVVSSPTGTNPPGINCVTGGTGPTAACSTTFFDGPKVTLTATPKIGSHFDFYDGACGSNTSTCTFVPAGNNESVGVSFTLNKETLTVGNTANTSHGTVLGTVNAASVLDCDSRGITPCSTTQDFGAVITLSPVPDDGFTFTGWTGVTCNGGNAANNSCTFPMQANQTVIATYRARTVVSVQEISNGHGTVKSNPGGINCGPPGSPSLCIGTFFDAKLVTLTAAPSTGSHFDFFSGACTSNTSTCPFFPAGNNESVQVSFTLNKETLTVGNTSNNSHGTIIGTANSTMVLDCDSRGITPCSTTQDFGTPISLQGVPDDGFIVTGWTGVTCTGGNTNPTCSFTMQANQTVIATYRPRTVVSVARVGSGKGTVVSTPTGIMCGVTPTGACTAPFFDAPLVTLAATPATGSHFAGYDGLCASANGSTCKFIPTGSNDSIDTTFTLNKETLTVGNTSHGVVLGSTAAGQVVSCDHGVGDCATTQDFGTLLTLTPVPDDGFVFTGWTGVTCNGGNAANTSCTFPMLSNQTVIASYRAKTVVSVARIGNGTGTVVSTPTGIMCGVTPTGACTAPFFDAPLVTLTATPGAGTHFAGFDGVCATANGSTCKFIPSGNNESIAATFTLNTETLTVVPTGNGSVTATVGPVQTLDCTPGTRGSGGCSDTENFGTVVTLHAAPNPGFKFVKYTGGVCNGATNATCVVPLQANVTVTPQFIARTIVTVSKPVIAARPADTGNGSGKITSSPPGTPPLNCDFSANAVCTSEYDNDPLITLNATGATGSHSDGFGSDTCTASGPTFCTIDPTGQDQITVTTSFTLDNHILDVTDDTDGNVTGFVVSPIFGPGPEIIDCGDNSEPQEKCGPPAVPFGTVFQLTATPDTGFTFDHWSTVPLTVCDGLTKTTCTFNLTADTQVTPHYRSIPLESINVTISPSSPIEGQVSLNGEAMCKPTCTISKFAGTRVSLAATAFSGFTFVKWTGTVCNGLTGANCSFTVPQSTVNVTATFKSTATSTDIETFITGQGSLTSNVSGVNFSCGGTNVSCTTDLFVNPGTSLTFTATPATNWTFTDAFGDCTNTTSTGALTPPNKCVVDTSQPFVSVEADFQFHQASVTISTSGNGSVQATVTQVFSRPNPKIVNCVNPPCTYQFDQGSTVTLVASAVSGNVFVTWNGDECAGDTSATCMFTLGSANVSVDAGFMSATVPARTSRVGTMAPGSPPDSGVAAGLAGASTRAPDGATSRRSWWWLAIAPGALMRGPGRPRRR